MNTYLATSLFRVLIITFFMVGCSSYEIKSYSTKCFSYSHKGVMELREDKDKKFIARAEKGMMEIFSAKTCKKLYEHRLMASNAKLFYFAKTNSFYYFRDGRDSFQYVLGDKIDTQNLGDKPSFVKVNFRGPKTMILIAKGKSFKLDEPAIYFDLNDDHSELTYETSKGIYTKSLKP